MEEYEQCELLRETIRLDWFLRKRRAHMPKTLEKHEDWQKLFYRHMPEILAKKMPKAKRPWHYSRIEKFSFDILSYLRTGKLMPGEYIYFFDYTGGKTPDIVVVQQNGERFICQNEKNSRGGKCLNR